LPTRSRNGTISGFMLRAIPDPSESEPVFAPYEAALEASCAALITLQLISTRDASSSVIAGLDHGQSPQVSNALCETITSLRRAIKELRGARDERRSPVFMGFVLGAGFEDYATVAALRTQSRPRRTA
jgi:hypothetical protein